MLRRCAILGLLAAVAACGPWRNAEPAPTTDVAGLAPTPSTSLDDRAVAERSILACLEHPSIDAWEARLRFDHAYRATTLDGLTRGSPFLARFREMLRAVGLPHDLAVLPVVESEFRVHARGPRGSVGLWQLQTPTARRFGLVVNRKLDERLDPLRATEAAVQYLAYLHDRYEDWPLALAAYNAGEGRIDRARRGRPDADYWELVEARRLSPITREYVPRFLATVRVAEAAPPSC